MVDFKDPVLQEGDYVRWIFCTSNDPDYPNRQDVFITDCFIENLIPSAKDWIHDHRSYEYLEVVASIYNADGHPRKRQVLYQKPRSKTGKVSIGLQENHGDSEVGLKENHGDSEVGNLFVIN